MLMVIFGAGASYDSAQAFPLLPQHATGGQQNFGLPSPAAVDLAGPWRPPLANDLFRDPNHAFGHIVQRYPKLTHIIPFLRQPSNGRSVEEELESLQARGGAERKREFASVTYYLRDLLFEVSDEWRARTSGVTNYAPLIGEILDLSKAEDPVCLLTFNYDLLLDRALISFGHNPQDLELEYFLHPRLKLFKPHGSVNWARFVDRDRDTRLLPQHLCDHADMIRFTDEFILVSNVDEANKFPQGRTVFPCIAIPLQNKTQDTFVWPKRHREHLEGLLPSITKILIIGWRAREAHFAELLRNNLPRVNRIMVVGCSPSDAWETQAHFVWSTAIAGRIDPAHFVDILSRKIDRIPGSMSYEQAVELSVAPGGFSDFVLNHRVIDFLKA
jgi:hypothetical protein